MYDCVIFTDVTDNIGAAKPLGAYKCAHSLRENGYSCLVVDNFHSWRENELLDLVDLVVESGTRLIGFSNTFLANSNVPKNPDGSTPRYSFLSSGVVFPQGQKIQDTVLAAIKTRQPNIKFVVGGARANPNESNRQIDYVCLGYSENSIVNLMDHLVKGDELKKSTKNVYGRIVIDDRKAEGYDFADSQMVWLPTDVVNQKVLPLEVARGCIFRCKFCSYPMNGKTQLDFVRNESRLVYELEKNYEEYGIFRYIISDDTFNDNDYKLDLFLNGIKRLKFQPEFWAYTRLDLLARNIDHNFQKLYDMGLRATQFGIETLNPKAGKIIGKAYDRRKQIEAVQHIRNKYGNTVAMHGTFIIGLPEESEQSCIDTFNLLETQELPLHSWLWFGLNIPKNQYVAWNSEIGLDYEKYGYKIVSDDKESRILNWANQYTTFERAQNLAREFNHRSATGSMMKLHNILGWSILTLGYTPEFVRETLYSQVNFNEVENRKSQFMEDYKLQLFDLLRNDPKKF